MKVSEAVIERINQLCKEKNLTINALCNVSGITQSTVNDIVNGNTYNAGIVTIKKLCDGLEMSIRDFFDSDLFSDLEQEIR
jgi:transcriptional regulator with XRE-family HTH domain